MELIALNENAYACLGGSDGGHIRENSGFVITRRGVVIIDTTWTLEDAAWMYRQIRCLTSLKILYVINTHFHPDHIFGNQIFDAPVIASRKCLENMDKCFTGDRKPTEVLRYNPLHPEPDITDKLRIVSPEITFDSRLNLGLGDIDLEVILLGGHTNDCAIVHVGRYGIVYVSDLLFINRYPTMRDGNYKDWVDALGYIESLGCSVIVPGHGPLCDLREVRHEKEYILELERHVSSLSAQGLSRDEIVEHRSIPKYWENDYSRLHKANIAIVYDQYTSLKLNSVFKKQ